MTRFVCLLLALTVSAPAFAADLDSLLARGEVTLLESQPDGHLKQVTTYARIHAPVAVVWAKLTGFADYVHWMPQIARSDVVSRTGNQVVVDWSIKVPGPNANFRARYQLDPAHWTVVATGISGAVEGGTWEWKLTDEGATTLATRTTYATAMIDNWIVRQFDDDAHTLEIGLNVATPVLEVRGLKRAIERHAAPRARQPAPAN